MDLWKLYVLNEWHQPEIRPIVKRVGCVTNPYKDRVALTEKESKVIRCLYEQEKKNPNFQDLIEFHTLNALWGSCIKS
jgi:hypothetical protein